MGRVALPVAKKFFLPAMKNIGKELFSQSVPEFVEVVTKMKTSKQAAKSAIRKTIMQSWSKLVAGHEKESLDGKRSQQEVGQIYTQKWKMLPNVQHIQASYSFLDIVEMPPPLVRSDTSFEQKTSPIYASKCPTLEFEITGDCTNFIDLQNTYLEVKFQILKADDTNLTYHAQDDDQRDISSLVNNTLHSLYSDCSYREWNQKIVSQRNFRAKRLLGNRDFNEQ